MEKKNLHEGHRQRVRNRYLKTGIEAMDEHNIIEFLLFFGVPYKDTNEIAHRLIDKFGNINAILDAPVEELQTVEGIGENAAALIKLVRDIAVMYGQKSAEKELDLSTESGINNYLAMKYMGETREIVYLLSINSQGRLENCIKLVDGAIDSAGIDKREMIKTALLNDVKYAVIAHNHPKGFAVPSLADVQATTEIVEAFKTVNVRVTDHIIVAEDGCFSMAGNRKYKSLFG